MRASIHAIGLTVVLIVVFSALYYFLSLLAGGAPIDSPPKDP